MDASTSAGLDWQQQLTAEMAKAGMTAPAIIIADGKLHRFDPEGGKGDAAYYVVHCNDRFTAWGFGNWRTGEKFKGHTKSAKKLTRKERIAFRKEIKERDAQRDAAQQVEWEKAAEVARARWATLKPASPQHPYLVRKKVDPCGARQDGANLVIAWTGIDDGKIWTLQEIHPDGFKSYEKGARKKGTFHRIGDVSDTYVICEGFATGATLAMVGWHSLPGFFMKTGAPSILVAGDASNLIHIAKAVRVKRPNATIILAADDDWLTDGNPGIAAAQRAAKATRGIVVKPWFHEARRQQKQTDFNDQHCASGIEDVRDTFRLAMLAHEEAQEAAKSKAGPFEDDEPTPQELAPTDFYALMTQHAYIFAPTRDIWPAASTNARLPKMPVEGDDGKKTEIAASAWLDKNRPVEQMTWAPGSPMIIRNRLISGGGWIDHAGVNVFNLYRGPTLESGDPTKAADWLEHVHYVYPDEAKHIIKFLAHRAQRPEEKINHALFLGGPQGIGKDSLLEPVKHAIGPWNFAEIAPHQLLGRFNGYIKSIILRISEAKDLGEVDRFTFYDRMKTLSAAPPDVLVIDEKNLREYYVPNVLAPVITSNYRLDGIYLPEDDRRHHVNWSPRVKEEFQEGYWKRLWSFYQNGGLGHTAAYLRTLDITTFDPKAPPPKTQAFWDIVSHNRPSEEAELTDAIERIKSNSAITVSDIYARSDTEFQTWLADRRNRKAIPHRMEDCGYTQYVNRDARDGLYVVNEKRQVVYVLRSMSQAERYKAVQERLARKER